MTLDDKIKALDMMFATRGWIDVIKPALSAAVAVTTEMWLNPSARPEAEKETSDLELRGRIQAMRWMLNWEKTRKLLVEQLTATQELQRNMEPATEGGSPYA